MAYFRKQEQANILKEHENEYLYLCNPHIQLDIQNSAKDNASCFEEISFEVRIVSYPVNLYHLFLNQTLLTKRTIIVHI